MTRLEQFTQFQDKLKSIQNNTIVNLQLILLEIDKSEHLHKIDKDVLRFSTQAKITRCRRGVLDIDNLKYHS